MYFELEVIFRLLLAAVLGGVIGAERERQTNAGAGLRTHALVAVAAALVMIVSAYGFNSVLVAGRIVLDPSRVAAQVISGVGFLGAGIIIFRRNMVRGLTTAASVWAVAAIGLACGGGLYVAAASSTIIMWLILTALKDLEKKYFPRKRWNHFTIELTDRSQTRTVSEKLRNSNLKILNMSVKHQKSGLRTTIKLEASAEEKAFVSLLNELQALPFVESVEYDGHALSMHDSGDIEEDSEAAS